MNDNAAGCGSSDGSKRFVSQEEVDRIAKELDEYNRIQEAAEEFGWPRYHHLRVVTG